MNIEDAKELKQSILFQGFCDEILYRIEALRSEMENAEPGMLPFLQEQIKVYRKVLTIPQDIIDRDE